MLSNRTHRVCSAALVVTALTVATTSADFQARAKIDNVDTLALQAGPSTFLFTSKGVYAAAATVRRGNNDMLLAEFDASGNITLAKVYRLASSEDNAVAIVEDPVASEYLLVGTTDEGGRRQIRLIRTDDDGDLLWEGLIGHSVATETLAIDAVFDPVTGSTYVLGGAFDPVALDSILYVARITSGGVVNFQRSYSFGTKLVEGASIDLAASGNGNLVITGNIRTPVGIGARKDLLAFEIDPSAAATVVPGRSWAHNMLKDVAPADLIYSGITGQYVVAGWTNACTNRSCGFLTRLDANLNATGPMIAYAAKQRENLLNGVVELPGSGFVAVGKITDPNGNCVLTDCPVAWRLQVSYGLSSTSSVTFEGASGSPSRAAHMFSDIAEVSGNHTAFGLVTRPEGTPSFSFLSSAGSGLSCPIPQGALQQQLAWTTQAVTIPDTNSPGIPWPTLTSTTPVADTSTNCLTDF